MTTLDSCTRTVVSVGKLEGVVDPHSICVLDSKLFVASTGTDEVVEFCVAGDAPVRQRTIWKASSDMRDSHHVNAVLPVDGRLLCSAFGPRTSERWSSAAGGYVIEIPSGKLVASHIEHPHSLARGPDDLYVAESRRTRVRGLTTGKTFAVEGYARGLCFAPDGRIVIGVSRGRNRSRSMGTIENPADLGEYAGSAALCVFEPRAFGDRLIGVIDLASYGPEIYDVIAI